MHLTDYYNDCEINTDHDYVALNKHRQKKYYNLSIKLIIVGGVLIILKGIN